MFLKEMYVTDCKNPYKIFCNKRFMKQRPKIGLGVILMDFEKKRVLLGKRKNAHGDGTWSFPGGHLEKFEQFLECAEREVLEETNLKEEKNYKLIDSNPSAITNDFFYKEKKHYVTLFIRAYYFRGKPKISNDEFEKWKWYKWNKLPENLFLPLKNLIKQNYNPFKLR